MPAATSLSASPFTLRPYAPGDEALYVALFTDAEVMQAVGPPMAVDVATRAAQTCMVAQVDAKGRYRHWVITQGEDTLGVLGLALQSPTWQGGSAELGVLLWSQSQGRGAATAAIAAVEGWAFQHAGLLQLTTHHAEAHAPAAALMRACGFSPSTAEPGARLPCAWIKRC